MSKYSFKDHPEHEAQLDVWRDKWIANALSTEPANQDAMREAIKGLYEAANLVPPARISFVQSPQVAAIAGSVAAGAWWVRKNPVEARKIGIDVSEDEIMAGVAVAADYGVRAALGLPLPETLYSATDSATYWATDWATDSATDSATASATASATRSATDSATALVRFLLQCCGGWQGMHDGGSDWSAWPAYLSFFDRVCNLNLPEYEKWRHYEQAALNGASRIMHEEFCIVSDRHVEVHVENVGDEGRLHCEDGPARRWADGFEVYYWHGVHVPKWVIMEPNAERALTEPNSEVRRAAFERIGWDGAISALGLEPIGTCADPANYPHELALYRLPEDIYDEPVNVLLMTNGSPDRDGSLRRYGETVPASITDPLSAAAWQYGVEPNVYAQLARRT